MSQDTLFTPGGTLHQQLHAGLQTLGLSLPEATELRLLAFAQLMLKWNKTFNLTALRQPEKILSHHLLDSLAILPPLQARLAAAGRLLDVGSGGGLPGIPLAIVCPELQITLVDSNSKKVAFLKQAAIELRLPNLQAQCARVEQLDYSQPWPLISSRAFAELALFVQLTRDLLAPGGHWLAMKGLYPETEIATLPEDVHVEQSLPLNVPAVDGERHLLILGRVGHRA
jgi:16S rRNA (guanine527-N7)-methyltransferase